MLNELDNNIQGQVETLSSQLDGIIKGLLKEEFVYSDVSEDLKKIQVLINKNQEEEGRFTQNEFVFTSVVADSGEINQNYSTKANAIILDNAKRVLGTYAVFSNTAIPVINAVFATIEQFRQDNAPKAAPTE